MCSCQKDEHSQILSGASHSQITAWWDKAVDIIPLNSGKGNAVAAVLRHYGFSKDEAIAFGDGHNDIEMLEAVGTGVAMGNAKDEVKAKADFVCKSVEEDGIYHYCIENKLIFLKRYTYELRQQFTTTTRKRNQNTSRGNPLSLPEARQTAWA